MNSEVKDLSWEKLCEWIMNTFDISIQVVKSFHFHSRLSLVIF